MFFSKQRLNIWRICYIETAINANSFIWLFIN